MEFDLAYIKEHAAGIETPIIITNLAEQQTIEVTGSGHVKGGESCFIVK